RHFSQRPQAAEHEGQQFAVLPASIRLACEDGRMPRHGAEQVAAWQVAPEHALLVARLLFKQAARRPAVRRRHAMPDARRRLVDDAIPRPVQAKRYIHILEVCSELLGKRSHVEQGVAAIERAGSTSAEDVAALQIGRTEELSVAALAGHAALEI